MYEIKPVSVLTFIEDRKIKLPRFQRKQTWDSKKNFKLCISIFKNYPIGVTVINEEKGKKGNTRWLLDGRQRRNALIKMAENPEEIYHWATKFLKIKNGMQPDEVEELFWSEIEIHLENDEQDDAVSGENSSLQFESEDENDGDEEEYEDEYDDDFEQFEELGVTLADDLDLLLNVILLCHNKTKSGTNFSRPFNFSKYIDDLEYVNSNDGYKKLDGRKLVTFINGFISYCHNEDIDFVSFTSENFADFVIKRSKLEGNKANKFKEDVNKNWKKISDRINIVQIIQDKLRDTSVGIIELKNATSVDAQNIFKLINSEGTDLTAVEILSAKPSWNRKIKNPSSELEKHVDELYKVMRIPNRDGVVRWDFPATLFGRLTHLDFIFKKLSYSNEKQFKTKLTLGFQIMSAIYQKGIKKEKVTEISKNNNIKWEEEIEILVKELNDLGKIISDHPYFEFLKTWNISLIELTSDSIAINYLILLYKDWVGRNKPLGSNKEVKKIQKNSIVLYDKMIYEYISKQWRGASDSKLENNIVNFNPDTSFKVVSKDRWKALLDEIFEENTLMGEEISKTLLLKPILYYFYFLRQIEGPNDNSIEIEIDHIIPQSQFNSSTLENKNLQHNLYNLALLPKKQNISKNNKKLISIDNQWLISRIEKYADIKREEFEEFSKIQNLEKLKQKRSKLFYEAFLNKRNELFID